MKSIFTSLVAALVGLTGYAQSFEGYEVSPEPGPVTELSVVEIIFPGCAEIEINSKDDLTATYNGAPIEGISAKVPYGTNELIFTSSERLIAPGEYKFFIPAYSIAGYPESYDNYADLDTDIVLKYTIEGGSPEGPGFDYEATPAAGNVTELDKVTVQFPAFEEIEILTSDDLKVLHNGSPMEGVTVRNSSYGSNDIVFTFPETVTAPGEYTLNIPAGTICGYDSEYNYYDLMDDINITYVIEKAEGELDFSFTANPESGSLVKNLEVVALTFPEVIIKEVDASAATVTLNGVELSSGTYSVYGSDVPEENKMVFVRFNPAITEGNVAVTLAAGAVTGTGADGTEGSNKSAISLDYIVAAPVAYNLTLALSSPTKPNADGEISADKQLDSFFFAADITGLTANSDASLLNVVIREVNGDYEAEAHLKKASGLDQTKTYFSANFGSQPVYNGEYVIIVEKGAFGDAVWANDPEYGHSNDLIEFRFTLIDGKDRSVFDIKPLSVLPAAGKIAASQLATVTVSFPEGVEAKDKAYATVAGVNVSFLEDAELIKGENGTYTATFENTPVELGEYIVSIVAGQFGDADYIAGKGGHGNEEIEVAYTIDSLSGISSAVVDLSAEDIYTVTGLRVDSKLNELPAGIYIIGGKKIIIR